MALDDDAPEFEDSYPGGFIGDDVEASRPDEDAFDRGDDLEKHAGESANPEYEGDQDGENDDEISGAHHSRRKWPWITGAAAIAAIAALYGVSGFMMSGTTPAHAVVSGVDVGGMTRQAATEKLNEELGDQLVGEHSGVILDVALAADASDGEALKPFSFDSSVLKPEINAQATLDPLVGFSWNPIKIWDHFFGDSTSVARTQFDAEGSQHVLQAISEHFARDAVDASFAYNAESESIDVTPAQTGLSLSESQVLEALEAQWLNGSGKIDVPAELAQPSLSTQTVQEFVETSVAPILAKPIVVHLGDAAKQLEPNVIGPWIKADTSKATPSLTLDQEAMTAAMPEHFPDVVKEAKDANVVIENHTTPKIIESEDGVGVDVADLAAKIVALPQAESRDVDALTVVQPAEFTTEDAQNLGVKEVVSEISTPVTADSHRTINLRVGSQYISNHVIKPGEQFNLQELLGDVTAERGFVNSGVSVNGLPAEGMGGGLSQVATNSFNVGYRAGMKDIEHQAHTTYYERYPMGMESTMWIPDINVVWENVTPYGAVVDSYVEGGRLVTKLWSTKYWDVDYWIGEPYAYTQPTTRDNNYPTCIPSSPGGPGFTVQWGRKITREGSVVEDVTNTWTYAPHDGSRCV
ncbi:MAG: VanW family protein [Arcanobacterium sp.]|nr:VanW family protein [Arcanobacterium sp.]